VGAEKKKRRKQEEKRQRRAIAKALDEGVHHAKEKKANPRRS
jgi:hypothetical protein